MSKKPKSINKSYYASRAVPIAKNAQTNMPASLDETTRSVEVIAATEEPAWVMDWERFEPVQEVLLMSGCRMPQNGQLIFLDSHSQESVKRVLGSFRNIEIKNNTLVGRTYYSTDKDADSAFTKVKEGHITDVSIGYNVREAVWLDDGQVSVIEGKSFTGPLRIATVWEAGELSLCPIGADSSAKVRKQFNVKRGKIMDPKDILAKLRSAMGLNKRADVAIVDDDENQVDTSALTEAQLLEVVDGVSELLSEAVNELENGNGDGDGENNENDDANAQGRNNKNDMQEKRSAGLQFTTRQTAQIERTRILGIQTLCRAHNVPTEIEEKMINTNVSLQAAKAQVLDLRNSQPSSGPGFHVSTGKTELEKFRSAVADSLCLRSGIKLEKPVDGASELQGYTMSEIAREMLQRSGQKTSGNRIDMVGRALTTTDLPVLLVENSRRILLDAYEKAPETWQTWCQTGIATDFKKSKAVGLDGDVRLEHKPEGAEYKEGKMAEIAEEYQIKTFAKKMVITREAIINDDLNALTELPRLYGEAASSLVGDVAYAALLQPGNMGDGNPLFSAAHGNLQTGKGGVPTVANLGAAVTAMKLQKDTFGKSISIMPKFFIAPVALETASDQFFNTQLENKAIVGNQASPLVHNPYGGNYFIRVHDHRLDNAAGGSPTSWYLAGARGTVTVFFLGGVQAPFIEDNINFNTDAIESKVRLDVGAKAMRWVTFQKATA